MNIYQSKLHRFLRNGLIGFIAIIVITPFLVQASSVVFQNKTVAVKAGQALNLAISIDPGNEKNYTARLDVLFPASLLEVTSFHFAKDWLPITQPGYDSLDNKTGELIRTAGYLTGFSKSVAFGTITFRAKKTGEGTITIGPKSFVFNDASENTLQSKASVRVSIAENIPSPTPRITSMPSPTNTPQLYLPDAGSPIVPEPPKDSHFTIFALWMVIIILIIIILRHLAKKHRRRIKRF